jgi:hypothetical protein
MDEWRPHRTLLFLVCVCVCSVGIVWWHGSTIETEDTDALAATGSPVIAAAGDVAKPSNGNAVKTGNLVEALNPARVVALGDLAYGSGTLSEYQHNYDPAWGSFRSTTLPVPGNHEWKSGGGGYASYFGDSKPFWHADSIGAWRLIGLDSECSKVGGCGSGSPQYRFLQGALASSPKCVLAYWHRPYWNTGEHGSASGMKPIVQLLQAQHADVILTGHDHNYQRFPKSAGLREFVVGTGGADFYGFKTATSLGLRPEKRFTALGVLVATLNTGGYSWQFRSTGGKTLDTGSATCS